MIATKINVNAVNPSAALMIDANSSVIHWECAVVISLTELILKMCYANGTESSFIDGDDAGRGLKFSDSGKNKQNENAKIIKNNSSGNNSNKHDDSNDNTDKQVLANRSSTKHSKKHDFLPTAVSPFES